MARLFLAFTLSLLFLFSFLGYFLAFQRLQTPPPPETLWVEGKGGKRSLKGRVVRLTGPDPGRQAFLARRGPGLGLEGALYLYLEATDAPYAAPGYPRPVRVAFLDARGQVLEVARLEPEGRLEPGLVYRGVLEVWKEGPALAPGDRVLGPGLGLEPP